MEKRQKQIHKVLEKYIKIRFNELKKIIVDDMDLMSEKTFRENLAQMVEDGIVKRIEIEKQHVEYTIKFDLLEYETEGIEYFDKLLSKYDAVLMSLIDKREKMSKIDQADSIVSFLKSLYLTEFRFNDFIYARTNPKVKSLKIKFQNIKDLSESVAHDAGEDNPKLDIADITDRLIVTGATSLLEQIRHK